MKVTYGAIVQRASGRFGGTVHSNWKGIDVVRRFAKPSNPQTVAQFDVRDAFAQLTRHFTLQSTEVRAAWDTFAAGKPFIARNAYIGRNVPLVAGEVDMALLQATPGDASTIGLSAFSAAGGVGTITPTVTVPSAPTGWTLTGVVLAAFLDFSPGGPAITGLNQWFEQIDLAAPYNLPITGLAAGAYMATAFIKWLAPDGSTRYSAAAAMDPTTVT